MKIKYRLKYVIVVLMILGLLGAAYSYKQVAKEELTLEEQVKKVFLKKDYVKKVIFEESTEIFANKGDLGVLVVSDIEPNSLYSARVTMLEVSRLAFEFEGVYDILFKVVINDIDKKGHDVTTEIYRAEISRFELEEHELNLEKISPDNMADFLYSEEWQGEYIYPDEEE